MRISHPRSPVAQGALTPVQKWDGGAARADALRYAGGNLDTASAQAKYKSFFLVCDGDPSNQGSYKFPYKRLVNGSPQTDPQGLAAAKAAAHGARSGKTNSAASSAASKIKKMQKKLRRLEKQLASESGTQVEDPSQAPDAETSYVVAKALDEERYTFGPFYVPDEVDAHGEYTKSTSLTKAMRDFVRGGSRKVHKQHDTTKPIGEIVDAVVWPYPTEVELALPGREVRKATMPAGTAYIGVVWSEEAWPAVKGGAITGYSMGGRAMRVSSGEILPPMRKSS